MREVIKLNTYKFEKQYKQAGTMNLNLALDTSLHTAKKKVDLKHNYIKAYMKLLSK